MTVLRRKNGEFDKIRGNVLTNTPGDPFSYRAAIGASFDGGKVVDDVSGAKDNFVRVSRGGNSITQGIEVESENSDTVTWGTSVETHLVTEEGGVKTGVSAGAEANGSVTWTNYNGAEYSGTVAGIPANVEQSYSFMWRFGTWDTMLNGQRTKVLGYLVKGQEAPPALPSDITVTDATADSLTLSWTHSNRKGVRYRICLLEDNEEETPIAEVSSARSGYTIGNGLLQRERHTVLRCRVLVIWRQVHPAFRCMEEPNTLPEQIHRQLNCSRRIRRLWKAGKQNSRFTPHR